MPVVAFLVFVALCIGLWFRGAPAVIVCPLGIAAWVAFTLVLWPKLRSYKIAMGIDAEVASLDQKSWDWLVLQLKGLKVLVFGFLTSMVPFLASAAQWLSGQNLNFFFDPGNPRTQQMVMFAIGAVVFVAPFLTAWLHSGAIADAAKTEPKG